MSGEELDNVGSSRSFGNSSVIREDWIEKQLNLRSKEFTEEKKLSVFIGTWNVNAKKPLEELHPWLIIDGHEPDIYVVGFQEIVDLNAGNLLVDHNASKPWEDKISRTLQQKYTLVSSRHLVGLSMCVYVKRALYTHISDVQTETVGVGIMGVGGNKGAVGIRFNLYDSSLCFINSHLAAHQHNCAGRNSDFHNICARIRFADKKSSKSTGAGMKSNSITMFDHDHLFWLGDLNYRLNVPDLQTCYEKIENQDWAYLLGKDQLILEKIAGNAFRQFKEGQIEFPPTYKYQPGTNKYERREDKKKRMPAWCDRIQYKGNDITQLLYRRAEELCCSDHKPVMAVFEIKVKILVEERKKHVYESIIKQLDSWENAAIPKVDINPSIVKFEQIKFDTQRSEKLMIENTGQVKVEFYFVPKLQEQTVCKKWLSVEPAFGIIPPKESAEITLTVQVTSPSSQEIMSGQDSLDDILILRLENGRDYFITIQGSYVKSIFGASTQYLVNTPTPIRGSVPTKDPAQVLSLPKELWRMVDFIFRHGMDEEGLFTTNGIEEEKESIMECLDTGAEFASCSVHSMAETLIYFLKNLADPVYPESLVNQYQDGIQLTLFCKQSLMQLTPTHYNTFVYIISFLREVLKHSDNNRLTPVQLVLVFAGCLMHTNLEDVEGSSNSSNSSSSSSSSSNNSANNNNQAYNTRDKPKAWIILRHFLTSDEFV